MRKDNPQSETLSSDKLLEMARQGNATSFGELYRRHFMLGFRIARRISNHEHASDIVHEAFLRTLVLIRDGKGPRDNFPKYLSRAVRNLAINERQSRQNQMIEFVDEYSEETVSDSVDSDTIRISSYVAEAFLSLPEKQRQVLWLTIVEQMPPRELVEHFGASSNSISQLASRARRNFRNELIRRMKTISRNDF